MHNLRMELDAIHPALRIFEGIDCVFSLGGHLKSRRQLGDMIAVAQPHIHLFGQSGEQLAIPIHDCQSAVTVLATLRGLHFAAEFIRHQLQPVADSQHRTTNA